MEHKTNSYGDLVRSIIRPTRDRYTLDELGPEDFTIQGKKYFRKDVGLQNPKGDLVAWSHYEPVLSERINKVLPWVVFCHGNWGSRLDALPLVLSLLPHNITVFSMDFAGSGRSDGEYVSLGWYEKDDLSTAIEYLRSQKSISTIGLWGQSMGAVTWLLYASSDHSIAGLVLDSPFSDLKRLWMELWKKNSRIPMFIWKIALRFLRRTILKKAKFDIYKLNVIKYAKKWYSPWKFFYPDEDDFVDPSHSKRLYEAYAGDKNLTEFDGDHNSIRPSFFYDSGAIFFHNVLSCDMIINEIKTPEGEDDYEELFSSEKLPEFDSTNFRKFAETLNGDEDQNVVKLDERLSEVMTKNNTEELKQQVDKEDTEMCNAIMASMNSYADENGKDEHIIDTLDRIGLFRQMTEEKSISILGDWEITEEMSIRDDKVLTSDTSF
jgi:pimeloyl-ACP methyl ester carboxylesterase